MKQFVVIGLGSFGYSVTEDLSEFGAEIIILDKDRTLIEKLKDKVHAAYIVDVSDEENIKKLIPSKVDAAILDLGSSLEVSILVTNYLKNMGIKNIIAKSDSDKQGEILKMVGATKIIYPDREAARQITPLLVSDTLYKFMPISSGLVLAEIFVPKKYVGKTLIESNIRFTDNINIVAIKKGEEYTFFVPDYRLEEDDILLAVGSEDTIIKFTSVSYSKNQKTLSSFLQKMFGN
ncbi:MAG: TrkA family potassium uptake protein [Spirochaetales bacterium]|nr:TrkA family potassium uptake protein [Spirochaetales bacterium]